MTNIILFVAVCTVISIVAYYFVVRRYYWGPNAGKGRTKNDRDLPEKK